MSKKVILTKKQAESLEGLKKIQHDQYETLIKEKFRGGWRSESYKEVNNISFEDFVDALLVGYEIKQPNFEVGDIVIGLDSGRAFKLIKGESGLLGTVRMIGGKEGLISENRIRHATKEEIFWAELGREVGEFRVDDLVQTRSMSRPYKLKSKQDLLDANVEYSERNFKGFYPAESFKKFPKE